MVKNNEEFGGREAEFRIQNTEYRIQNRGVRIQELELTTSDFGPWTKTKHDAQSTQNYEPRTSTPG